MYAALKFPFEVYIICHRCTEKEKREKQHTLLFSVFSVTQWQNFLFNSAWSEAVYSRIPALARRVQCRLWGVRYISTGILSLVTGTTKNELGVAVAGVKVRIIGSSISTISDALGNFSLNTSLYGDLEIEATHINYEKTITDFVKEDGVAMTVAVVMVHL